MRTVGILQPGYLPWLGFFDQLRQCDIFVLYDDVQFDKNGWRNRNVIKTATGPQWLTVPVQRIHGVDTRINEIRINNTVRWQKTHTNAITQNYSKTRHFLEYGGVLKIINERIWENLVELDTALILYISACFGIKTPILRSSELGIGGGTIDRLIAIVKKLDGTVFLEGKAGRNYITKQDEEAFTKEGITLRYHEYNHPIYEQRYGEFISYMSAVDLLFNCGKASCTILKGN